jgi:hypothetical protein
MEYKRKESKEKRQKRYREGMKYDKKKERKKNNVNEKYISFHLLVPLMRGRKPLPKRAVHVVRSRASSFK